MTYIEVKYDSAEQRWVATSVHSDDSRVRRCDDKDYNLLIDEAGNWGRLLQAEVRVIKD